jgi:hypothetical protein
MEKKVNGIAKKLINAYPSWNELLNHALQVDKNFNKILIANSMFYEKHEIEDIIPEFLDLIDITNHIGRVMVDYPAFTNWGAIKIDKQTKLPTEDSYGIAVDAYGNEHKVNGYEFIALMKVYLTTWLKHPKYDSKLNQLRIKFSYSTETLSQITD